MMEGRPSGQRTRWLAATAAIIAATALSLIATGFAYGINNNVYHIPYVLDYAHLPQFRHDAFYASLERFVSLIWPAFRAVATEDNVRHLFFAAHVVSRLLAFIALHFFFRLNGLERGSAILAALAITAATPWLMQYSVIGVHGLFLDYFTHSEVTWAPVIGAVLALQFRRFILMGALSGITFCINPFVAFWLLAILAVPVLACGHWRNLAGLAKAAAIFLLISAPELIWALSSIHAGGGAQTHFDFRDYVHFYFPLHFLIDPVLQWKELAELALIFGVAMLASRFMPDRRFWSAVSIGGLLIVLAGWATGDLIDSRLLFNLELIRAAGMLHFFAMLLTITALLRVTLADRATGPQRLLAALGLMALLQPVRDPSQLVALVAILAVLSIACRHASGRLAGSSIAGLRRDVMLAGLIGATMLGYDIVMQGPSLAFAGRWLAMAAFTTMLAMPRLSARFRQWPAAILIMLALLTIAVIHRWNRDFADKRAAIERPFHEMTCWVRQSGLRGPFLLPVSPPHRDLFDMFQLRTLQPAWVDWKQGAAALWEPSFHDEWRRRLETVGALRNSQAFFAYAATHRIPYIVLPHDIGPCRAGSTLFDNGSYAICRVRPAP